MESKVESSSRVCPLPPGPMKDLNRLLKPRSIMALSLTFLLTTTGLVYTLWQPRPIIPIWVSGEYTPHGAIAIDGDANFTATALMEGWPGDGSPENPFIIEGLEIVRTIGPNDNEGHCIFVNNTRVSFTISHCNLTGGGSHMCTRKAGITLVNVSNGLLVNNNFTDDEVDILLIDSHYNTVGNNTCYNYNIYSRSAGIILEDSFSNTVVNNTLIGNEMGIELDYSTSNTVIDNTCYNNDVGIILSDSESNIVVNNTCNSNDIGISLLGSDSNTVANNTCNSNDIGILLDRSPVIIDDELYWEESHSNIVTNNTCNGNDFGIYLDESSYNTVMTNTCNNNRIGIYLSFGCGYSNIVVDNTCLGNTENDIVDESMVSEEYVPEVPLWIGFTGFIGFIGITLLGGLMVGNRVSKGE